MIQQLVQQIKVANNVQTDVAAGLVLRSDPMDIILRIEQVWDTFNPGTSPRARSTLWGTGTFSALPIGTSPAWDHLGYSMSLENTRAVQIIRRVVREYRTGEGLGVPSADTQLWLDTTEALLFDAGNPLSAWLSTSTVRPDPEAVRRNAYWRLFGIDLAFGADDNRPFVYDKANAANTTFVPLFEELLFELWLAIANFSNTSGVNNQDDDRIFRITEQLSFILRSRRQAQVLSREELAAATALGWVELTLSTNTPVVEDLRAQATSSSDRLKIIGERVGLAPHSRAASFFSMAADLSVLLRAIEGNVVAGPAQAVKLYDPTPPSLGEESRRVITEWSAATGKDLKQRARPVDVNRTPTQVNGRQLVASR